MPIKAVILAGGLGSRISEETLTKPKPLINIGQKPIIWYIMCHFRKFGIKNFKIAAGYKSELVKEYFIKLNTLNSDFEINLKKNSVNYKNKNFLDWNVGIYDTGLNSQTGSRIKRLEKFLNLGKDGYFLLTYGDGLSDVNIKELIKFHLKHGKIATVTAVRPPARFGYLGVKNSNVTLFKEKNKADQGWINGGFFVLSKKIFEYLNLDERCVFESDPMERLSMDNQLMAFKHEGFWQCMDTKRDHEYLEKLLKEKKEYFKNDK